MADLKIFENDLSIVQGQAETVSGQNAKAQRINARLSTIKGERFDDIEFGLDYRNIVWNKSVSREVLAAHVQQEILKEADAGDEITFFEMLYNSTTRDMIITVTLTAQDGTETSITTET